MGRNAVSKTYRSVSEMVRDICDPDFADQFEERLLLKELLAASELALQHVEVGLRDAVEKAHKLGFEVQRPTNEVQP